LKKKKQKNNDNSLNVSITLINAGDMQSLDNGRIQFVCFVKIVHIICNINIQAVLQKLPSNNTKAGRLQIQTNRFPLDFQDTV